MRIYNPNFIERELIEERRMLDKVKQFKWLIVLSFVPIRDSFIFYLQSFPTI